MSSNGSSSGHADRAGAHLACNLVSLHHVAGDRHDLDAGDVLAFPGNLPHSYQNPEAGQAGRGVSVVVVAKAGV